MDLTHDGIEIQWGVRIPTRDGIHLNATLYTHKDLRGPASCIVTLTPYTADHYHERGTYFAAQGLVFIIVEVRGRGNSEGTFLPFIQEAHDSYDVVEWVAQRPFSDGKVAMWGGSYGGYTQWAAAKEFPPHLATIVPTAAPYLGVEFPMRNNIFCPYLMRWLTLVSGNTSQRNLFSDERFWLQLYRRWHHSGRSFRDIDVLLGNPSPILQEWLSHPEPDSYWDACNPTANEYARLRIPILTITGSYDDDQPGALEHYKQHLRNAQPAASANHFLVIGPWDHAGTRTPQREVGGVRFGPDSLLDLGRLHLEWYAWTLRNGRKPDFLKKNVAYYVTGAERWQYADTLEEITTHHEVYFLDSMSNANAVSNAGSLGAATGRGDADWYVYDPRETQGPEVDAEACVSGGSLVDQSIMQALRGRLLVYDSAPLQQDLELSGFCKLSVWIAINCSDTDIYVSLHDVDFEGNSVRLTTDAMRARYRQGLRAPRLVQTEVPLLYEFDRFTFVARRIKRGHRLRLVLSPTGRIIESAFTQKNYNGGGVVAEESVAAAKPVTVKLFHDAEHPSALLVPIGHGEEDK